jgi:BON domain
VRRAGRSAFIAGGLVLLVVGVAPAQTGRPSGSSGGSSAGGFTGSSGGTGGFTGSSGSGGGSSGGTGGFTGSSGSFTGSSGNTGSSSSSSGTGTTGATSPLGRYYGNPLYNGLAAGQTSSTSSTGSKYLRPSPVAVSFGTPLYNAASLTRSPTQGMTGLGTQGGGTTAFGGATSAGIRRASGYVTEPVFDMPDRPALTTIRPELQAVVSRATRLPSRDRIQVLTDGDTIVLRGQVRDERERRLAEAMIRLSPGVRLVRNELESDKKPPAK